jgi:hypothetical protein
MGEGLVRSPDDFGTRGEPPTHPELLDFLADEYRTGGWSAKHMIRQIVTSATYRQASRHRPELLATDPLNTLWHRQSRYRVEAELVRDIFLCAGGTLSAEIGGPGVYPPLPAEVAKLSFRSNYVWPESKGKDRYRRGMYVFYKRTLPYPALNVFDCPDATVARMQRETSNTPLQALTTLNNESHVEMAQALGQRLLTEAVSSDSQRIDHAYRICLSRSPSVDESRRLLSLLASNRAWYSQHRDDAEAMVGEFSPPAGIGLDDAAAWVATLGIVLNLDEFLTRE